MTMEVAQVRLPRGVLDTVDGLVESGHYANRSDVIRHAIRMLTLEKEVGSIPYKGNAVKLVRKARKALSKGPINLKEINNLCD